MDDGEERKQTALRWKQLLLSLFVCCAVRASPLTRRVGQDFGEVVHARPSFLTSFPFPDISAIRLSCDHFQANMKLENENDVL